MKLIEELRLLKANGDAQREKLRKECDIARAQKCAAWEAGFPDRAALYEQHIRETLLAGARAGVKVVLLDAWHGEENCEYRAILARLGLVVASAVEYPPHPGYSGMGGQSPGGYRLTVELP